MTLTKAHLADLLAGACTASKAEAKQVIDGFFEELNAALERGEKVKLARFGLFALRDKRPRPGRNPRTGEEKTINARRVVVFHASDELKLLVERERTYRRPVPRDRTPGKYNDSPGADIQPLASDASYS